MEFKAYTEKEFYDEMTNLMSAWLALWMEILDVINKELPSQKAGSLIEKMTPTLQLYIRGTFDGKNLGKKTPEEFKIEMLRLTEAWFSLYHDIESIIDMEVSEKAAKMKYEIRKALKSYITSRRKN